MNRAMAFFYFALCVLAAPVLGIHEGRAMSEGSELGGWSRVYTEYCVLVSARCEFQCIKLENGVQATSTKPGPCKQIDSSLLPSPSRAELAWEGIQEPAPMTSSGVLGTLQTAAAALVTQVMQLDATTANQGVGQFLSNWSRKVEGQAQKARDSADTRSRGWANPNSFTAAQKSLHDQLNSQSKQIRDTAAHLAGLGAAQSQEGSRLLDQLGISDRAETSGALDHHRLQAQIERERGLQLGQASSDLQGSSALALDAVTYAAQFANAPGNTPESREMAQELLHEAKMLRKEATLGDIPDFSPTLTLRVGQFHKTDAWIAERLQVVEGLVSSGTPVSAHTREAVPVAKAFREEASRTFFDGGLAEGEGLQSAALSILDFALGVTPVLGTAKDAVELVTGKNLLTGEELSTLERSAAAFSVLTLGAGGLVKGAVKALPRAERIVSGMGKALVKIAGQYGQRILPEVAGAAPQAVHELEAIAKHGFHERDFARKLIERSESRGSERLGHMIRDHVGKSDDYLKQRLPVLVANNSKVMGASTFNSIEEAEAAVGKAFKYHATKIGEWVESGMKDQMQIDTPYSGGRVLLKDSMEFITGSSFRMVLRKAKTTENWYIHTGMMNP
jgi:hypothetical protein